WDHPLPELHGKVMAPFLGKTLQDCVAEQEIGLDYTSDGFVVRYFDNIWPLSLPGYTLLERQIRERDRNHPAAAIIAKMVPAAEGADYETWRTSRAEFLHALTQLPEQQAFFKDLAVAISGDPALMFELVDRLYYRPAFWRDADRFINYRRFFTVNELICLRMEDDSVFDEYHAALLHLHREKVVNGFRIDHIDGLNDPARYTQRLREVAGDACYIIAEKILEESEDLPPHWPIQGTSGYEFLSHLNQLLTHRNGARDLLKFYKELVPEVPSYRELILTNKQNILKQYLQGEWDNLVR